MLLKITAYFWQFPSSRKPFFLWILLLLFVMACNMGSFFSPCISVIYQTITSCFPRFFIFMPCRVFCEFDVDSSFSALSHFCIWDWIQKLFNHRNHQISLELFGRSIGYYSWFIFYSKHSGYSVLYQFELKLYANETQNGEAQTGKLLIKLKPNHLESFVIYEKLILVWLE